MKKILLIHPNDESTAFAKKSYSNQTNWTILNEHLSKSALRKLIQEHDIIIMLGHGTQSGLLNPHHNNKGYIIDSTFVYALRHKYCVGIWCYASQFFQNYGLTGWSLQKTFISDMNDLEFVYYHRYDIKSGINIEKDGPHLIQESNNLFTEALTNNFLNPKKVMKLYDNKTNNPIIEYNKPQIDIFNKNKSLIPLNSEKYDYDLNTFKNSLKNQTNMFSYKQDVLALIDYIETIN